MISKVIDTAASWLSSTFGEKPVISDRILENTFLESLLCKDSKYDKFR
jgi:hypothetical protein